MNAAIPSVPPSLSLRPPSEVMCLSRMGAMHASRLSFAPTLLRRVADEGWSFARTIWAIDAQGFGHAVYTVTTPRHRYSLIAFSRDLPDDQRTDRVIAEAWDTSYVLYDGVPDAAEIERLAANAPRQEAGRFSERDLVLSRANRSVRLFETVVSHLAAGTQPPQELLESVGYLMRTTAVYGNGKFGIADRDIIAAREDLNGPFQAEMLTVWLIRSFTLDLVDHVAGQRSPEAVRLAPDLRRRLGVGNSTGLGMAPFLVRHPLLLHNWMLARETALARVRAAASTPDTVAAIARHLAIARAGLADWVTQDATQAGRIARLDADLARLADAVERLAATGGDWDVLYRFAADELSVEAQEFTVSLLLEPNGALVDDLTGTMAAEEAVSHRLDGAMSCGALAALLQRDYGWALDLDRAAPEASARFWYVSEEKLEPRLGTRALDDGAERELPLTFAHEAEALSRRLADADPALPVAELVARHPELRHIVRRVQFVATHPYAEIRDNLVDGRMRPIDLLRCKLSFFGASRFDPRSDLWLRITLFHGAPFPEELCRIETEPVAA
ncbi:hypothetical protein MWN34_04885 [Ancylobacter sp. 6x-1]|uniref:Uncharacterized protein n=1 Tax=Ancylobacter crimeensis TaxID=2579147 RepID=A0ABT0D8F8_9HYPH|nr:hypothetical protein [Ancylobacter crimeensis]MCK0196243.1 hypothetical protein [Ancylobacter crimeensis]